MLCKVSVRLQGGPQRAARAAAWARVRRSAVAPRRPRNTPGGWRGERVARGRRRRDSEESGGGSSPAAGRAAPEQRGAGKDTSGRAASPKHGGGVRVTACRSSRSRLHSRSGSGQPLTWEGEGWSPVASSDPGSRVRAGRGWVNCATVAVSAGGAVRDTRVDSACPGSRPNVRQGPLDMADRASARSPGGQVGGGRDG
jgi:hypothetical protein